MVPYQTGGLQTDPFVNREMSLVHSALCSRMTQGRPLFRFTLHKGNVAMGSELICKSHPSVSSCPWQGVDSLCNGRQQLCLQSLWTSTRGQKFCVVTQNIFPPQVLLRCPVPKQRRQEIKAMVSGSKIYDSPLCFHSLQTFSIFSRLTQFHVILYSVIFI